MTTACADHGALAEDATGGGEDHAFFPSDLVNTEVQQASVGLTLVGFSLFEGESGLELYAAARNDTDEPVCEASMITSFFDAGGQALGQVGTMLESSRYYRLPDAILACIDPGEITMGASRDLPPELAPGAVDHLEHEFPAFVVEGIAAVGVLRARDVKTIASPDGRAYVGSVANPFDVPVSAPHITIFPVNRAGRPLAAATTSATLELAPGDSWRFETSAVPDTGTRYAAYPAATVPAL